MALLVAAKGTFADLGKEYNEEEDHVDQNINCQIQDAKVKLAFLSDAKYLTFLGRLPYEGGKLTKIVTFSRNAEARHLVKMVTREFGLPDIPDPDTVEQRASIASIDSVKLKLSGHPSSVNIIQFINETKFPLKLICGTVSDGPKHDKFKQTVAPRSSYERKISELFSVGGYMLIYLDGEFRADDKIHDSDETRVIEFSYSGFEYPLPPLPPYIPRINMQDKTGSEFTEGMDTYKKMKDSKTKFIYWMTKGVHYLGCAELIEGPCWRFVVQDFNPLSDTIFSQCESKDFGCPIS